MRRLLLCALVASACGGLSNEDLRFQAVLPDEALLVDPPEDDTHALGDRMRPLAEATKVAGSINAFTRQVIEVVRNAAATRPSEREHGRRVWGPFRSADGFARLVMTRDDTVRCEGEADVLDDHDDSPRFRWKVQTGPSRLGPFETLVDGRVRGESFDLSCGTFRFDLDVLKHGGDSSEVSARWIDVHWSRTPTEEQIGFEIDPTENDAGELVAGLRYRFERNPVTAAGRFSFSLVDDSFLPNLSGPERADLSLQWSAGKIRGRADWRVFTKSGLRARNGSLCWETGRGELFHRDDVVDDPVGTEAACGAFENGLDG